MTVLILALLSAFFVGLNNVLIKKALGVTSRGQAILVSLVISSSIFLVVNIVLGNVHLFFVPAAALFLLAGLLGPGVGRTLGITSTDRIGVSRTLPIVGVAPFFATILAILFLNEEYSTYLFIGMALIVLGIFLLSRRKENGKRTFDKRDLLIPLGAAVFGGSSIAITKVALNTLQDPVVGAGLALGAALCMVVGYIIGTRRLQYFRIVHRGSVFSVLAGLSMAGAFFLNFSALKIGDVSVVAPVFSTFPLFGVFLSRFLLKEHITGLMWLSTFIIIAGVAVIQVF